MSTKETTLRALAALEGNPDFEEVLTHLEGQLQEAIKDAAEHTELIYIGRAQGRQHALGDFIRSARDARLRLRHLAR